MKGREGKREGGREGGRKGERERGREGGSEGEREGRKGGRENNIHDVSLKSVNCFVGDLVLTLYYSQFCC